MRYKSNRSGQRHSFSLVELMIVIGVISLLSLITVKSTKKFKCRSLDLSGLACMKRIKEKLAIGRDEFPNPLKCDAPINLRCLKEDVNRDDQVNVADSQAMLNFLLTTDPDSPDRLVTGYIYDVDGNGETDLVDFAAIVSCLGSAACPKSLNDI